MRRNFDIIRSILVHMQDDPKTAADKTIAEDFPAEIVYRHIELMAEADFITAV